MKDKYLLLFISLVFLNKTLLSTPIPGLNTNIMSLQFGGLLCAGKSNELSSNASAYKKINIGSIFGFEYIKRTYAYNYHLGLNYLNEGYKYTLINSKETPLNQFIQSQEIENKFISIALPLGLSYTVSETRTSTVDIGFKVLPKMLLKQINYVKNNYVNELVDIDNLNKKSEFNALSFGMNLFASIEIPINYDYSISVIPNIQFNNYGSKKAELKSNLTCFGIKIGLNLIN